MPRFARKWNERDVRAYHEFHREIAEDENVRGRQDDNRHELIEAMKRIGARVYPIGKPLDYLVTFRKRTLLVEIKNPDGRNRLTKEQEEFIASWDGEIHICRSVEEVVNAVVNGCLT